MNTADNLFRLNVGFIIHENVGYQRDIYFDIPSVHLHPDLDLTELVGTVRFTRTPQGLLSQIVLHAQVIAECVRCLDEFSQAVDIDVTELYVFSPEAVTETCMLLPEDGVIDITSVVRDEMLLAIPIKPLCHDDCQGLCPICGENRNQVECHHEEVSIDPRLAVLKTLLGEDSE